MTAILIPEDLAKSYSSKLFKSSVPTYFTHSQKSLAHPDEYDRPSQREELHATLQHKS